MKCVILFEIFKVMKSKIKEVLKVKMYSILHVFGGKEGQLSSFLTFEILWSFYDYTHLHSTSVTLCLYSCVLKEESMHICIFVFTTELCAVKR